MPAKKSKTKSRVSSRSKKPGFKFRWWMGVVIVAGVLVIGIVVVRFSHAGSNWNSTTEKPVNWGCPASIYGIPTQTIQLGSEGPGCVNYYVDMASAYQTYQTFKPNTHLRDDSLGHQNVYFGQNVKIWTIGFQKAHGLTADGIVGPLTWGALIKACYVDAQCR